MLVCFTYFLIYLTYLFICLICLLIYRYVYWYVYISKMPRQPRHRALTGRHRNRVNEHIVNFIFNMCRMLDRVTDTFLQPSQRKCSCSSRLLGMAFQLRRCLAFLQPFFFLHSGLWHCRHVLQCIHKSIKNNRKSTNSI